MAWVLGFGSFASWFWRLTVPCLLGTAAAGIYLSMRRPNSRLAVAIVAGALGGLLGTIGYDVVRTPFLAAGYRLFAPINAYGLLILNTSTGSPLTDFTGWSYNFANGIGFGVAYAMVGLGRHWAWAVLWALGLETMTIITPYADVFALRGKLDLIAIAYGAHVAYGVPLGLLVRAAAGWPGAAVAAPPLTAGLAALLVALLLWHRPYLPTGYPNPAVAGAAASTVLQGGRFHPEWMRVPVHGCALVRNEDNRGYVVSQARGNPTLAAAGLTRLCFDIAGVRRLKAGAAPYSGGFVIVDPAEGA